MRMGTEVGRDLADAWFRRRMEALRVATGDGEIPWLVPTGRRVSRGRHRAAELYRRATDALVSFPQTF